MIGAALALATVAGSQSAAGELEAGRLDDMVALCQSAERAMTVGAADQQSLFDAGACNGFIYGVLTGRHPDFQSPRRGWFCAPDGFTTADVVLIFNGYVSDHPDWPETLGDNPADALVAAIREAWPCR